MAVWFNGEILESASVDAANAGSLLGWGVFTTIGVRGGRPILLERHYTRLARDAAKASINFDWTWEQFALGIADLLQTSGVHDGLARATLTSRGDGRWNTAPGSDLLILIHAATPPGPEPLRLWLAPYPAPSMGPLSGVKTTSYSPFLLAWQHAQKAGCHDALLINTANAVCETARANLFWFSENILFTPALSTGCLAGVGREFMIELAELAGIEVQQVTVSLQILNLADEVFVVSAATGPRLVGATKPATGSNRFRNIPSTGFTI